MSPARRRMVGVQVLLAAIALAGGLLDLSQWTTIAGMLAVAVVAVVVVSLTDQVGWSHGVAAKDPEGRTEDQADDERLLVQLLAALLGIAAAGLVSGPWVPLMGVVVYLMVAWGVRAVRVHVTGPAGRFARPARNRIDRHGDLTP